MLHSILMLAMTQSKGHCKEPAGPRFARAEDKLRDEAIPIMANQMPFGAAGRRERRPALQPALLSFCGRRRPAAAARADAGRTRLVRGSASSAQFPSPARVPSLPARGYV